MDNIYNAIQNLYNMDKTTWQEVLAELYNLVSNLDNKFDLFEAKFGKLLGEQVTKELKKMYDDGSLGSLINDVLLKDINTKVDTFKTEVNEQLEHKANEVDLVVERNRIDLLTKIDSGQTEGNTELLDIRNGADGVQYTTAGESVRNQFKNILNNFTKGYTIKTTVIEGQSINAWIWSNTSGYWTEDNSTSITKKYPLEKGKKYVISGNTANANVTYGFSDNDYKTALFMEFPQKISGGTFNFEFIAQRNYIYVYYSKTTNSNDTINCVKKENDYLEFIDTINDDIYKYDINEYNGSFVTSTDSTKTVISDIRLIKGHEYEITVSADVNLNQTKFELGCGLFNKAFNKDNFDLSKVIKFSFISTETNKNRSLWIYFANHLSGINVNVTLKDITGMKKVNNNIDLSFSNGAFNGGAIDYATTKMIRTNNIFIKKECLYLVTYPTDIYSVYNIKNSSGTLENHDTYGSFSVKGNDDFLRLSFARIDGTDLNISNFDTSQIKVYEIYSNNKNYDITVSAPDTIVNLKEKSDLILQGTDLTHDTRLIQSIIGCDTSIDVLFYHGTYKLNEIHKTKYGQYGILTTNEWIKNNSKMVNIYGYQGSVFASPKVDFQVTESLHNSLNSLNENAIFLIPNPETGNVTGTCITLKGLLVENYDIDKAIVGIDFTNAGATNIENTMVKVQKYPGYTKFTQEPNKGLVGIRVGYGSCYGIRNSIKRVSVRHHYTGHSCNGEHFIYEDVKAHDCMIGFAFGDKYTQPKMEHPNMMIGCSIEQCARLMLLSRYGETTESEVENGEVTLVCIGLSTETWFKGIGDGEGYNTLPIKEVIKGLYRGKIEGDYRGKSMSFFENDGSGKNIVQLVY